ncbi:integrase core domain-containing protein [Kribbella sp. CA-253562]|uniref:integrase core domain-containing protein n=1 Tax=Kribbella sp. CA-253562 TaxID=3239942 RepID=UPI003D8FFF75
MSGLSIWDRDIPHPIPRFAAVALPRALPPPLTPTCLARTASRYVGVRTHRRRPFQCGSCDKSRLWAQALADFGVIPTDGPAPNRLHTNGEVERFNRTLLEEWALCPLLPSETERRATLTIWLHTYNHPRGQSPGTRVPNLSGRSTKVAAGRAAGGRKRRTKGAAGVGGSHGCGGVATRLLGRPSGRFPAADLVGSRRIFGL